VKAGAVRLVDTLAVPGAEEMLALLAPSYEVWWRREAASRVPLLTEAVRARGLVQRKRTDAFLRAAHAAGVRIVPGSGAPNPWLFPGEALHGELARLVEAGFDPATVLALATRGAASALGEGERRGAIAPERIADLLVVAGDPREDLGVLADPELVVLRGRALPREALEAAVQEVLEARQADRKLLEAEIAVEPPPRTEGARLVLAGHVENWAVGQRVGAERFHVERLTDGTFRYVGRIKEPGRTGVPTRELIVRQDVLDGDLTEFSVAATDGTTEVVVEGLRKAGKLRIRKLVDDIPQGGVQVSRENVVALDAGTATSFLILAREPRVGPFPMLTFHEALEAEVVNWQFEIDASGDWQLGTPLGALAFRLDERGAPTRSRRIIGRGALDGRLLEAEAFGGAGHPLPEETRAWVEDQAALARARLEAGGGAKPDPRDSPADADDDAGGADGDG